MRSVIRFLIVFVLVSAASAAAITLFDVQFGSIDFWSRHGVGFLLCIAAFPRLTLLLSSVATGGILWWLGWFFAPRLLVAILATVAYFETNPILVVFAWLCAIGGETAEKSYVKRSATRGSARELGIDDSKVIDV